MSQDTISDALLITYRMWVDFALGKGTLGGHVERLKNPSGRYAAAITAKKDDKGKIIGIYVDDSAEGAKEARIIEYGHPAINLKDYMLRNAKVSKAGYRYRRLNLRQAPISPLQALSGVSIGGGFVSRGSKRSLTSLSRRLGRIWADNYKSAYGSNWRVMSDAPGSSPWRIPAMKPYSVAHILKEMLSETVGPAGANRLKLP